MCYNTITVVELYDSVLEDYIMTNETGKEVVIKVMDIVTNEVRKEVIRVLVGHTSPETAYVVDDYPYGYTLRCKIRYWVETTKNGQRMCSQTTNPKVPGEVWNKPKKGTYAELVCLYLNQDNHVHCGKLGSVLTTTEERFNLFVEKFNYGLQGEHEAKIVKLYRAVYEKLRASGSTSGRAM